MTNAYYARVKLLLDRANKSDAKADMALRAYFLLKHAANEDRREAREFDPDKKSPAWPKDTETGKEAL